MLIARVRLISWVIKHINVSNIDYTNYFHYGSKLGHLSTLLCSCFMEVSKFLCSFMAMVKNAFTELLVFFFHWYRSWCWVFIQLSDKLVNVFCCSLPGIGETSTAHTVREVHLLGLPLLYQRFLHDGRSLCIQSGVPTL